MAATTTPVPPVFSYAQAAKGLAPATPANPANSANSVTQSQTEPLLNNPDLLLPEAKSCTPESEKPDLLRSTDGTNKTGQSSKDVTPKTVGEESDVASALNSNTNPTTDSGATQISSSHSDTKPVSDSTSSSLIASAVTLPPEDELLMLNGSTDSWDKHSESSASVDKTAQNVENGREKSGDDEWINVQPPKTEKELKAAPIPVVNIWQQRKEAQEARAKASAALRSSASAAPPHKPKQPSQPPRSIDLSTQDDETKKKANKKPPERTDEGLKKKQGDDPKTRDDGKRISRQNKAVDLEKDAVDGSTMPPPVRDAALWPTPETANIEDRKKFLPQDKGEKGESKSPGMKPNQKWVPVPYVPTAKFSTPLPPTASRRGGRLARGAREGGSRGGHTVHGSISERSEKPRTMGPPPVPKPTAEQQRGRDQETSSGNRATSAPTHGRRAASVGPALADQRRTTPVPLSDRGPFDSKKHTTGESQDTTVATPITGHDESTPSSKPRANSKSFARQTSASYRPVTYESPRHVVGESHAHPRSFSGTERRNTFGEAERQNEMPARRGERTDASKDGHRTRDLDPKSDSWRDREFAGERPEQRNGRGRGGFRGRGNISHHATTQSNQTHAFTAPLPQQPFSAGKPHVYGDRHRQSSTPYPAAIGPTTNSRSTSRSQSIPSQNIYSGMQNNFASALSPIQTDLHAVYGGYNTMYPGIMSAIPYSASMEPMAVISTVSAQVDYYFSIENLCKDMYLRSHMDSQGWVPLSVIAGFNRIKSLTEDMNLIRHVCQMSRNLEFRPGDDGVDRIRKVDKWDQWILDMDQRQAHAQNDGPPPLQRSQSPGLMNSIYHPSMSQMTSPTWTPGPFFDGYAEPPTFHPASPPSNDPDPSPPIADRLPDIPSGEDFSLTNGQAEQALNHSTDALGPSTLALRDVPSTSPNGSAPPNAEVATVNGHTPASPQEIGVENAFSKERMNELHVCVRHSTHQFQPPFVSHAARTFSHGSIDTQMPINAQMATPMPSLRGGAGSPEGLDHAQDRFAPFEDSHENGDRGVFWMKDGAPPDSWNQEGSTVEKYQSLRDRALMERIPGNINDDMDWLYQFWSHFLVRNFNDEMYTDFSSIAWEDAAAGNGGGLTHLSRYYEALLTGPRVLTEQLAEDIVKLSGSELDHKRQTFFKLRSAWRNGAFNFKSRKMIDKHISPALKAELEK